MKTQLPTKNEVIATLAMAGILIFCLCGESIVEWILKIIFKH